MYLMDASYVIRAQEQVGYGVAYTDCRTHCIRAWTHSDHLSNFPALGSRVT